MFIAALFKTGKKSIEPKYLSADEYINKCIHTKDYFSEIKRNDVFAHAMMWVKLSNIMLNEGSQMQKTIYSMIPFI